MPDNLGGLVGQLADAAHLVRKGSKYITTSSIANVAKVARVEPIGVISRDCLSLDYLPDIMQATLTIFTGYYLQAIALVTTSIGKVKVAKILDSLNPDRDFATAIASMEDRAAYHWPMAYEKQADIINISTEAYQYRLPIKRNTRAMMDDVRRAENASAYVTYKPVSLEDKDQYRETRAGNIYANIQDAVKNKDTDPSIFTPKNGPGLRTGDDTHSMLMESANLSVGRVVDVEMKVGEKESVKVPVTIRISHVPVPTTSIVNLLVGKSDDTSFTERFHAWRAGRIRFIQDLIFAQDLLKEHKKQLMLDKDGVLTETLARARRNSKYGLMAMNPSLATASNIYIISEDVARQVENKLGGKLQNVRIRQKAFENTYAMIIIVVDRNFERVTFYIRDTALGSDMSIKELRSGNKSKNLDPLDIMRTIQSGNAISF